MHIFSKKYLSLSLTIAGTALVVVAAFVITNLPRRTFSDTSWDRSFESTNSTPQPLSYSSDETDIEQPTAPKDPTIVVPDKVRHQYPVLVQKNLSYGKDPLHKVDLYYPKLDTPSPIIIFVHGGGWQVGARTNHEQKATFFASHGYAFASIDYRLFPAVSYQEQAHDVATAVSTIIQHARLFNGDTDHIFLMGHSAGAHLADLVSTDNTYLDAVGLSLNKLSGTIVVDTGATDLIALETLNPTGWADLFSIVFGEDTADRKLASPRFHVAPDKGIPPHLILYSLNRRVTTESTRAMKETLTDAGIDVYTNGFAKTHAEMSNDIGNTDDPINDVLLLFLEQYS